MKERNQREKWQENIKELEMRGGKQAGKRDGREWGLNGEVD